MAQKQMIVKVQVSVAGTRGSRTLIYNESRDVQYEQETNDDVLLIMAGRPKAFFYAEVKDKKIHINNEAPWQDW
jgi:hypothetical protein